MAKRDKAVRLFPPLKGKTLATTVLSINQEANSSFHLFALLVILTSSFFLVSCANEKAATDSDSLAPNSVPAETVSAPLALPVSQTSTKSTESVTEEEHQQPIALPGDLGWTIDDLKTWCAKANARGGGVEVKNVEINKEDGYESYWVSFTDGSSMMGTINNKTKRVDAANLAGTGPLFFNLMAYVIALSNSADVPAYKQILTNFVGEEGSEHQITTGTLKRNGKNFTLVEVADGYMFRAGDQAADDMAEKKSAEK